MEYLAGAALVIFIVALYWWAYRKDMRAIRERAPDDGVPPHASTSSVVDGAKRSVERTLAKNRLALHHSRYEALAKLKALHLQGAISDQEFESEKEDVLSQGKR